MTLDSLIETLLKTLPLQNPEFLSPLRRLITNLPAYQQRTFLVSVLQFLDRQFLQESSQMQTVDDLRRLSKNISSCAGLIREIVSGNAMLLEHLTEMCIKLEGNALVISLPLRRSVLASLANDEGMDAREHD